MPSPIANIFVLCASLSLFACSAGRDEEATQYNPPAKITASPEPFRPSEQVTFAASIYAPNTVAGTGNNPALLVLQLVPVDTDGKRDFNDKRERQATYPGADSSNWATATFDAVDPPAAPPGGMLEVSVAHKIWKGKTLGYVPLDTGGVNDLRTAYFRMECGTGSGSTVAERQGSSVCIYKRQ